MKLALLDSLRFWFAGLRRRSSRVATLEGVLAPEEYRAALLREIDRADRNLDLLSVVALSLERCHLEDEAWLVGLNAHLRSRLRSTDDIGWMDASNLGLILSNTPSVGAWQVAASIRDWLLAQPGAMRLPRFTVYSYPWNEGGPSDGSVRDGESSHPDWAASDDIRSLLPEGSREHVRTSESQRTQVECARYGEGRIKSAGPYQAAMTRSLVELLVESPSPVKRFLDVAGAAVLIVLSSPILLLAALAVGFSSKGPIIFRQQRAGRGGRPFTFYKFRTMVRNAEALKDGLRDRNGADGPVFKMEEDPRRTKVGRLLRKTSIDEFPQLFNVLKGDMSLVGPRPPTLDEVPAYERWQRHRLLATGGLTCLWQVNGRSNVGFVDWVRMDRQYLRRRSLILDLKLLFLTVPAVLTMRGAK